MHFCKHVCLCFLFNLNAHANEGVVGEVIKKSKEKSNAYCKFEKYDIQLIFNCDAQIISAATFLYQYDSGPWISENDNATKVK